MKEADCYGVIDIARKKSILFVPRLPETYAVWMGKIQPPSFFRDMYILDEAHYVDELDTVLTALMDKRLDQTVYTLHGLNSDSSLYATPATFPGIEKYRVDNGVLHPAIVECRGMIISR